MTTPIPSWAWVVVTGLLGLAMGSFLNVVIARMPIGQSISRPRSRCPRCAVPIAPRDNVPVASWVLLRGRCRACRQPISPRYPLVEGLTGVLFALGVLRFGLGWELCAYLALFSVLVAATGISVDGRPVPAAVPLAGLTVCTGAFLAALVAGSPGSAGVRALVGTLAATVAVVAVQKLRAQGTNQGDLLVTALVGLGLAWLSWWHLALGLGLAFATSAVTRLPIVASLAILATAAALVPA